MQVPPRRIRTAPRRFAALAALLALLVAVPTALAAVGPPESTAAPGQARLAAAQALPAAELAGIVGGTCTTCSDDGSSSGGGGGSGGSGSSGSVTASGSPYWETYRVTLNSTYDTPASMVSQINNWADIPISGTYQYTYRLVRDVRFSGGFASFVSVSVGGEVSRSTTATVTYPIPARSYGKLFVKYRTERRTYYGRKYQPMSDGSRVVVGSDSGPYESTSTILGYVTGGL